MFEVFELSVFESIKILLISVTEGPYRAAQLEVEKLPGIGLRV